MSDVAGIAIEAGVLLCIFAAWAVAFSIPKIAKALERIANALEKRK